MCQEVEKTSATFSSSTKVNGTLVCTSIRRKVLNVIVLRYTAKGMFQSIVVKWLAAIKMEKRAEYLMKSYQRVEFWPGATPNSLPVKAKLWLP